MGDIDMLKVHSKGATLELKLKADSGYSSTEKHRISADQWRRILAICGEQEPPK